MTYKLATEKNDAGYEHQGVTDGNTFDVIGGCLVPDVFPAHMPSYTEAGLPLLDLDELKKRLAAKRRPMRERFDASWAKSQGMRGSCNGYAGAKGLSKARVVRGEERIDLSGEGLYMQINGGRDGGSMLADGMKCLMENGIPPESMVPHLAYQMSDMSAEARAARARFKARGCYAVDTEQELASGLYFGGIGVVAVHVDGSWRRMDAEGATLTGGGPGNHSVNVDDVILSARSGELLYDMDNSHGADYGQNGRAYLRWARHLASTVRYHRFYIIPTAIDDPEGKVPPNAN